MDTENALELLGRQNYRRITERVREAVYEVAWSVRNAMHEHDIALLRVPEYGQLVIREEDNGYGDRWDVLLCGELGIHHEYWTRDSGNFLVSSDEYHPAGCMDRAAGRLEVLRFARHIDGILRAWRWRSRNGSRRQRAAEKSLSTSATKATGII